MINIRSLSLCKDEIFNDINSRALFLTFIFVDDREKNKTNPPTVWFIGATFEGRLLKVVIIPYPKKGIAILRTAYEPSDLELEIYEKNQSR